MAIERIVIVDESDANVLFFEVVLKGLGMKDVQVGRGGNDALDVMKKKHSQFAIVAWEMNAMPGTVFVQKARQELRKRHLPYLIYSKRLTEQDLTLVKELGFANVLTMPLDKEKAAVEIKKVLDHENNLPREEARLRKIEALIEENKPSEALKLVDASLRKKGPFFVRSHVAIGQIWLNMGGQQQKAEAELKAALAEEPNNAEALNLMAGLFSKQGKHQEAIDLLKRLSESSPKNLGTMLNLGSAYVDANRHKEAKDVLARVSMLDPDSTRVKDESAKIAFKDGDMSLAAKLLAETRNGDNMARYFNNLAIAMTHRGDFGKAIETYENAIKLLGDKAKLSALQYNLGLAFAKKGDLTRSFVELVKSYKSDPSFEKAYAALVRIGKQMDEGGVPYDKQLVKEVNQARREHKAKEAGGAAA